MMINLPLGLSLCFTFNSPISPAQSQERPSPVSNTSENTPIFSQRASRIEVEKPKDNVRLKLVLIPRSWWAALTAKFSPQIGSAHGDVKALAEQMNTEVVHVELTKIQGVNSDTQDIEADQFLELSRPPSRGASEGSCNNLAANR
ncbi:hypothetical protein DFH28DRAFT_929218 [Melampsora americana]|nr:hypothetical protein DFH28DRAFT_929218 [Melampsora americana]